MLTLTSLASEKLETYLNNNPEYENKSLRIFVQGSSCSGYSYGLSFDQEKNEDTLLLTKNNIKIITDSKSLSLLQECVIDFLEDENHKGFIITNNKLESSSKSSCGDNCNCNCNCACD